MPHSPSPELVARLEARNQRHLLAWWDDLAAPAREELAAQIAAVDFDEIDKAFSDTMIEALGGDTPQERARRAEPPRDLIRLPRTPEDHDRRAAAARQGEQLLAAGKVGVILVAGGQGTRLGFDHPKGMYAIGPVSNHSLFQILIEQAVARSRRAGAAIPYYVMTSDATHDETVEFLTAHNFFGLPPDDVRFFRQGNMPAVDATTGRLLLAEMGELALSPDGHGGMLAALQRAGLLADMRRRGVEYLYYHQVDNPTAIVCDPVFLGLHASLGSEMSTKVAAKRSASEPMGVVAAVDGKTQIIEYSDMPAEVAALTDERGELLHWAGNTAIHAFNVDFLERLSGDDHSLPFHRAFKKVDYVDASGRVQKPAEPNAYKFERFIFDALTRAQRALVVEADREAEFCPVKNASGADSRETCHQGMTRLYAGWLRQAGISVADGVPVEISPLYALDADELCGKVPASLKIDAPLCLRD